MASKEYWASRERRVAAEHRVITKAINDWPRPRSIDEIEADEVEFNQPVGALEFGDPRNS
jgi:hypothetical protein